ncbi:MAG: oxidoreductase FAD/NAD(P)-binding domain protein [Gemmatimonadetes bacterium]|jgi:ferredoxin-NADP reductase|nr:oxidoreductase FAD/NAD(P)-binding domain protein [Gemmatimonadota bacterium]
MHEWRLATVVGAIHETATVWTFILDVPGWPGHRAGQYVDVRLVAKDGDRPKRSFSIASAPGDPRLALTIERLKNGEVSPHLCDELHAGDQFELRGPLGNFVWDVGDGGPLLLVAGGSGIVPLMAMLRHRAAVLTDAAARRALPARLLYSSRREDEIIFRAELERLAAHDHSLRVTHTITRKPAPGWKGALGRIDRTMLATVAWPPADRPRIYICGPSPLVTFVETELKALGHDPDLIRIERFGPTGDKGATPSRD